MRDELENIERIERYLRNELPEADKQAFELEIKTDKNLQIALEKQQQLLKGVERKAWKEKAQLAFKKYKWQRNLGKGGMGLGILIVVFATAYALYNKPAESTQNTLPELNEQGEKVWADADRYLPTQHFSIDATKDTVIETEGGMVLAIPAGAFTSDKGSNINGSIDLEVKEALKANDIIKAGLSTKSGDQLLETGGMFYINGKQNGNSLKIDPSKGIFAEVPTNSPRKDFQLYEGKRRTDGTIDWVNPKPLGKWLKPVDIHSLNFYPPHYEDSLSRWGYDIKNKKFKDSLYYSFARLFGPKTESAPRQYDEAHPYPTVPTLLDSAVIQGINPAKVKTIWSDAFQNTLIATKQFEERMPYIHNSCSETILDLYVNNLGKNLCTIDSMAARIDPTFYRFAARGEGKVKGNTALFTKLRKYYTEKSELHTIAIRKTQDKFWEKQHKLDIKASKRNYEQYQKDSAREENNFRREYEVNLCNAYQQLGKPCKSPVWASHSNTFQITNSGWGNVDQMVYAATSQRKTLTYTENGKTATIRYEAFSVSISNKENYDRVVAYLLPDSLNSFMRLNEINGRFNENLNMILRYKLVIIGYKGIQAFYYEQSLVDPKDYDVALSAINNKELERKLQQLDKEKTQQDLRAEAAFQQWDVMEQKRINRNMQLWDLTDKTQKVIFPCLPSVSAISDSLIPMQ